MTDTRTAVRFDLGSGTGPRMDAVRAQLAHLFPPGPFPVHVGYGAVPSGWRQVDAWRVIPDRASARFLLPVDTASARRVVLSHNGLRSRRVATTRRLAALAIGPLALLQGDRTILRVCVPAEVDDDAVAESLITRHLLQRVPGAVATAVSLRDFHPRAKPTVHVLGAQGRVLAFAKVASDPSTGERVLTEADLLRRIGRPLATSTTAGPANTVGVAVRLPAVHDSGRCGPFAYSVVEPLPQSARGATVDDEARALTALSVFAGPTDRIPLGETALWADVMGRVAAGRTARGVRPDLVAALDDLVSCATRLDAATPVQVGCYHGDWVPWNMAWAQDTLWVWDLEYGSTQGPIGLDGLRWVFQIDHVIRGASFTEAVAAMRAAAPRVLPALGLRDGEGAESLAQLTNTLVRLHVVETMGTALGLLANGRGLPRGVDPDAGDVMRRLSDR